MGIVPGSGTLITALPVPELGAGVAGTLRHVQAWVVDATGGGHLGSASVLLMLDRSL
jgi:hypothetical protein